MHCFDINVFSVTITSLLLSDFIRVQVVAVNAYQDKDKQGHFASPRHRMCL